MNISEAQRVSTGNGVIVAVIDTGVNANHRDLTGNVLPGADVGGSSNTGWSDTDGHGTAMASIIAAHGHGAGNEDGVLGIAPGAKVLPVRDAAPAGKISSVNAPRAIDAAVDGGAKVISMSFGVTPTGELDRALRRALAADVVLVAATGNHPEASLVQYPARFPGVIAVGATDRTGHVPTVTVTGPQMILSAPGVDIVSASRTGGYATGVGTSAATAIVAGAAALVRSRYPDLSATEVVHRLTATATDKGAPGRDSEYGYGELNVVKALVAVVPGGAADPSVTRATPSAVAPPASAALATPAGYKTKTNWYAVLTVAVVVAGIAGVAWTLLRRKRRTRSASRAGHL
jgi:type VII secretion-associated serine protease mycosin